ncbi:MAG: molybdenum cofactor biosynthesis protein MoaE [Rhodobacteraceae bacterium]|nr:molybdenum cofactor biosynthesis protein MoaE [Paracoccaceae bacterium]
MRVSVAEAPFDVGREVADFSAGCSGMGAIVSFTGIVRDLPETPLEAMEIEHYPGMTEAALEDMARRAIERFSLGDALIIHRHGRLAPGETIMMVATAAPHRKDAFDAAEFLMDFLKSRAPFWKREITAGGADWVAAKDEDEDALARW